ncbi:class I SAM-dependent methyltransferase [Catellatospora sp. NPDC049111]|uniref:class I SAM-dependent methyltransferase n=1 Tax=Catellatospora sp. NPDC049111 TaxID=3155271 RepID=UPI0033FC0379
MTEEFSKAYWEDHYHGRATGHGHAGEHGHAAAHGHGADHGHAAGHGKPANPQLVAEIAELTPGTALDAGCGEGAEAIWLATQGWQVTALDIADSALRRARSHAQNADEAAAGRIDWLQADLSDWTPPAERFDLVCSLYVHPTSSRESLAARLAAAVAPGGTLLIVGHHPSDPRPGISPAAVRDVHFTAAEVAAGLDPDHWEIVVAESRHRPATDHEHTFHDTVLRARKLH